MNRKQGGIFTSKNLIIYYSRAGENYVNGSVKNIEKGNSEVCAEFVQNAVGGDLFKVETLKPYSKDYYECTEEAKREKENNDRPKLKAYLKDISEYDTVFILAPCWWGTYPMAMFTQLEMLDFTDKNVATLITHEGSGLGNCEKDLRKICKGANFGVGMAVHGADATKSENAVSNWAKKIVG